jgi:drug/metabolite transporter (DMT)-like permease
MSSTVKPTLVGSIAVLLWGISALWVRFISQAIGGLRAVIAFHTVAALLSLGIWLYLGKGKEIQRAWSSRWFYVRLLLFCINVGSFFGAFALVSKEKIPVVILINYLWPTITLLESVLIVPLPITRKRWFWFGCAIVLTSLCIELLQDTITISGIITESDFQDCLAYVFAFSAALAWGTYSAITRKWGAESGGAFVAPLFSFGSVLVATLLLFLIPQQEPQFSLPVLYWVVFGAVANSVAFWCWDYGILRGNLVVVSLLADGLPWISLLAVHFVLGAPLHQTTIATAIMLVMGGLCTRYGTLPYQK